MPTTFDKYVMKNKIEEDEDGRKRIVLKEVPNTYYVGLLDQEQMKFIEIYKMAISDMLTNISNLDIHSDDFYDAGFLINRVDFDNVNKNLSEDNTEDSCYKNANDETKLITVIFKNTTASMKEDLNNYIISLIDDMDEDEYKKRLLKVFDEDELKEYNII